MLFRFTPARHAGIVQDVFVVKGDMLDAGDLLLRIQSAAAVQAGNGSATAVTVENPEEEPASSTVE